MPIALVGGLLIGALNGLLIVRLEVPDLLATLGMLFVLQGLQLLPSRGQSISTGVVLGGKEYTGIFTDAFLYIGRGAVRGRDPVPDRDLRGRRDRALGGARPHALGPPALRDRRQRRGRAARGRARGPAADGRLHRLGRARRARRDHPRGADRRGRRRRGQPYLLDAVAAALVGYAVLAVNRPNMLGTDVGAVFLGIMLNGLTIKNFPYYTQDFVKGVVLMVALLLTFGVRRLR